jgi:hypothetical protein
MASGSKNTISKVVIILFITLSVLGAISYFSYQSYQDFTVALDKLYNEKDEVTLTENILGEIGELETRSRAYSLTESPEDLELYVAKVKDTKAKIDSLYFQSYGKSYHDEVDTLRVLFRQKVESFRELMALKNRISKRYLDRSALDVLTQTQKAINKDSVLVPKQEITTTTVTRTETPDPPKEEEKGWLKSMFSKKEKPQEDIPVRSEVREEKVVAYDSTYFGKVDTLITTVKTAIKQAELARKQNTQMLTKTELELVNRDHFIVEKLRTIILTIRELEAEDSRLEKQETLATARASFGSVILFALCGGALSIVLIYFVLRDILRSNKMQKELAVQKKRAEKLANVKEEFLANMSHEIRTPLNSIIGFSEQMDDSKMDNDEKKKLKNIRSSGEHLLMLVNDILDYSKIESGKLRFEKIGFKVETVLSESLATLEHLAQAKGIELQMEIEPALRDYTLKGDPIRLKQILINLAGNGVKFTERGYVKITAAIDRKTESGIEVQFNVEDTGKGIEADKIETIFDSFDQEDTSISRRYGGTGLGLTICKKLVKMQHGLISVQSEVDKGSTFIVSLFYGLAQVDEFSKKTETAQIDINLEGKSLLLIDDDSMNHVLLKPSLERWGLSFESAYNGDEGIARASRFLYDFILVDLQMPGKSGEEVIMELKKDERLNGKTFIILCTANAMVKSFKPNLLSRVDATLLKPFKEYEVAQLLAGLNAQNSKESSIKIMKKANPVYSLTNFRAYAGDDPDVLRQFLVSFISTNHENLALLKKHFENADYANVGDTAHKMKNTFGQLEAEAVMEQLIELEKLVDTSQPKKDIEERISKTFTYAEQIFSLLEEDIEELEKAGYTSSP